ncbi:MAG: capsule assembly Wzi family protein [Treponema sp.]|nr:capsule assembly Wzi family protein [Treponema sp.]
MKKLFILIILFFVSILIYGQLYDMILTGDPVLQDLRFLTIETGRPFLSFSPPLSQSEIKKYLDKIDESLLSAPALEAYNRILNRLNPTAPFLSYSDEIFSAHLNVNLNLVGRIRFNEDVSWEPYNSKIEPFAAFPVRFFFSDFIQLYAEPGISMRTGAYGNGSADLNIPTGYYEYNSSMPLRVFAAAGGSFWNFQLGRDRLYWGTANLGSLTFNDNSPYMEYARLSLFSSSFKYSLLINQMPLTLHDSLFNIPGWDLPENLRNSQQRYLYLHRFDFTLFDRVNIGLMEGVIVGNSSIELRYLNPLMIFHSFFSWENYDKWKSPYDGSDGFINGSIISLELNWNIIKNLAFYGQIVINDFATSSEMEEDPSDWRPNGVGYLAGITYSHSFKDWGAVFYLEFLYTDPYLYMLSSPFASFIQLDLHENDYNYYLLGFSRDTIGLTLGAHIFNNDTLNFTGSLSWISRGSHNKDGVKWDWQKGEEAFNETTPSGIAENKFILSIGGTWKPYPWLLFKTNITGILSFNNNHVQGNNTQSAQVSVTAGFRY